MKVLVAHNRYTAPGGEDTVYAAEKTLLKANGHTVIAYEEDNSRIESMSRVSVASRLLWSRESRQKLLELLVNEKPDVAHFHNTFPLISPSAYYACREANIPVVQTLHNFRLICPAANLVRDGRLCSECVGKRLKWPAVTHACYHDSSLQSASVAIMLALHGAMGTWQDTVGAYIALTQFSRDQFIQGGLPGEKLFVKPNFASTPTVKRKARDAGGLVFVGRLSEEKGIFPLIEAMTIARHVPLRIIGDGPLAPYVDEQIERRGLTHVKRTGQMNHSEVMAQLESASCLVQPSICFETFGMTIVEAFSRRLPVITSDIGAMAEIVEHGITGMLAKSGDAADLADRIGWAWANKSTLAEMGEKAYEVFVEKYSAEKNYEMLLRIYQSVMGRQ